MAASVSYRINGKYDGKAISQAKQGMSQLADTAKSLKGALGALGAVAGVKVLVSQFKEATKTFKENNKVQTQMFQALSNNAKTAKSNIKELVKEFDSMSGIFGGSDIVKGGTLLARMGLDEDQMRKTTKAAKDLAASGVMTLEQAFDSLGKSYSGNITSLKKLFPELQNLTKEELEAGKAVEILGNKFKGMESALGDTFEGQITILKDKIDAIKNTIGTMGGFLVNSGFNDMASLLDKVSDVANKFMPSIAAWTTTIIHSFANFDIAKIFDPKTTFEAWKNMFEVMAKNFLAVFNFLKSKIQGVWNEKQLADNSIMLAQMKKSYSEYAGKTNLSALEQQSVNELKISIQELEDSIAEQQDLMKVKGKSLAQLMSEMVYNTSTGLKNNLSLLTGEDMTAFYETQRDAYGKYTDSNFSSGAGVGGGSGGATTGGGAPLRWKTLYEEMDKKKETAEQIKSGIISSLGDIGIIIKSALDGSWVGVVLAAISSAIQVISEKTTILTEILSLFDVVFRSIFTPEFITMLNNFFGPIMEIIKGLGESVGYILSIISEVFGPILMAIGKAVEVVAKVIQSVLAVCYNIYVACWNFFHSKKNEKDYKSLGDIWSNVGNTDFSKYSAGLSSSSVGGTAASYNAARDVIVNISFNNSYVNGDAREIAVSLYNEFRAAERMGYIS